MDQGHWRIEGHHIAVKRCGRNCPYHRPGVWRVAIDGEIVGNWRCRSMAAVLLRVRRTIRAPAHGSRRTA